MKQTMRGSWRGHAAPRRTDGRGTDWFHANRYRRLVAVSVVTAAFVSGGAWPVQAPAGDAETFKAAYEAAVEARKAAAAVGFEWRDTKKMLRQAKKLAEKGEYEKAVRLANKAKRQGDLGVQQAEEQETAWRAAVLK